MNFKVNKLAKLARKGRGEELIFITNIVIGRNTYGGMYVSLWYSEVYGCIETSTSFEDIDYLVDTEMTDGIRQRLLNKWGEEICKDRGVIL